MDNSKIDALLRELALTDWEEFMRVSGVDRLQVTICIERKKKKSIRQIANKTGLPKSTVEYKCKKCPTPSDGTVSKRKK